MEPLQARGRDDNSPCCLQCLSPYSMGITVARDPGLGLGDKSYHIVGDHINLYNRTYSAFRESASSGCAFCGLLCKILCRYHRPEDLQRHSSFSVDFFSKPVLVVGFSISPSFHRVQLFRPNDRIAAWPTLEYARQIPIEPSTTNFFQFARDCLQTCLTSHHACSSPQQGYLPKRLLFVGCSNKLMRLVEDLEKDIRYAALSYCWGEQHPLKTTKATLQERKRTILWHQLPLAFQDAVVVARSLDIEYLWIDSLCIIQDSNIDWEIESSKMSDVYRNAYFTISAAHTSSCHLSFLQPRSSLVCNGINIKFSGGNTPTQVGTRLISSPHPSLPLDLRGWTLQEQHLSARILRFTEHEMIWICRTLTDCECGAHPEVFPWKRDLEIGHNEGNPDSWWLRIAENFSTRQLSFDSDKLPALAGIAAVEHERTRDQYLAGLWKGEILTDICWHPRSLGSTPYRSSYQYKIPTLYRAPSFSWASINGPVTIRAITDRLQAKLLDAEIRLAGLNPFGQVSGGCVVLECPTVELTLVCTGTFDEENVVPSPGPARPGTTIVGHCYFLQRKDKNDAIKPFDPDTFVASNSIELESGSPRTTTRRIEPGQIVQPFQCTVLAANLWHMDERDFLSFDRGWIRECSRTCLILAASEHMGAYERIGCTAFGYQKDDAAQTDWFFGAQRSIIKIV